MDKLTPSVAQPATDQSALWNGPAARGWVEMQETLDRLFASLQAILLDGLSPTPAPRVLDVGCGTGGATVAAARLLGPTAACVGIDISEPMIAAARARADREATPATFICGDASVHAFDPPRFDWILSRFGVMFFPDPVRAFTNLRAAAAEHGRLRFIAWRSASENPFMTTAERAAAPVLPQLPARDPDAPGQFAFADSQRVRDILVKSGWLAVDIQPVDVPCVLPEQALVPYLTRLGPVGRVLQELDDHTRAQVIQTIRPAFDPYLHGDEIRFTAACWMVNAQGGS